MQNSISTSKSANITLWCVRTPRLSVYMQVVFLWRQTLSHTWPPIPSHSVCSDKNADHKHTHTHTSPSVVPLHTLQTLLSCNLFTNVEQTITVSSLTLKPGWTNHWACNFPPPITDDALEFELTSYISTCFSFSHISRKEAVKIVLVCVPIWLAPYSQ